MTPENVMDLAHSTLTVTAMMAAPLLLTALITGLVIGMLQAATQINEATLSFIPKLLVLVLALFVSGPWILRVLIDFTRNLYSSIRNMIAVTPTLRKVAYSLMFESPTMTCSRRKRSASACGSSLVLMIGRDLVVADEKSSHMWSARWLMQNSGPRAVWRTFPAPA